MKRNQHIDSYIDAYLDREVSQSLCARLDAHLVSCARCKRLLAKARQQLSDVHALPASLVPPLDLWPSIAEKLTGVPQNEWKAPEQTDSGTTTTSVDSQTAGTHLVFRWAMRIAAGLALTLIGTTLLYLLLHRHESPWHVTALEGNPRIGNSRVATKTNLKVGDVITTDAQSRARIGIDSIGQIDVGAATAIQFVEASDTRRLFALKVGEIHAKVDAPPRLFVVTTPNVTAVDLGCDYSLQVDSTGAGVLRVYFGWVSLEYAGVKSIVPAGDLCLTRPGAGPGTPFSEGACDSLREALSRYDFQGGDKHALQTVLRLAQTSDALTLWHLLFKVDRDDRSYIYDRLTQLISPPHRVTRTGFLAGDTSMIRAWQERLDIYSDETWQFP